MTTFTEDIDTELGVLIPLGQPVLVSPIIGWDSFTPDRLVVLTVVAATVPPVTTLEAVARPRDSGT